MLKAESFNQDQVTDGKVDRHPVSSLFETYQECPEEAATEVQGEIPDWLAGTFLRIGPGKFEFGDDKMNHWFDGHCIIHRFHIADGKVTFQSKFLDSKAYKANMVAQRVTLMEFGTFSTPDPCASAFTKFKSKFLPDGSSDNPNVSIFKRGDVIMVLTDGPVMHLTNMDLSSVAMHEIDKKLSLHVTSAHPHFDRDGTIYSIGTAFGPGPKHYLLKIPPGHDSQADAANLLDNVEIITSIPSKNRWASSYSHSFGMTENYLVYCEGSVVLSTGDLIQNKLKQKTFSKIFRYEPEDMAIFHVIKRSTGEVLPIKYQIRGLFFFHQINCYEEDNHIVFDIVAYDKVRMTDVLGTPLENLRQGVWLNEEDTVCQSPKRFVFPLVDANACKEEENLVTLSGSKSEAYLTSTNTLSVQPERLLPEGQDYLEMPTINYDSYNARKYRYFYGCAMFSNQHFINGLGKVDVETRTSLRWKGTADQYPGEPIFVPRPGASDEDDGVVLSSVCDTDPNKRDFMLMLDGKTFIEIARAYVPAGVAVPFGIHGSFYK